MIAAIIYDLGRCGLRLASACLALMWFSILSPQTLKLPHTSPPFTLHHTHSGAVPPLALPAWSKVWASWR